MPIKDVKELATCHNAIENSWQSWHGVQNYILFYKMLQHAKLVEPAMVLYMLSGGGSKLELGLCHN